MKIKKNQPITIEQAFEQCIVNHNDWYGLNDIDSVLYFSLEEISDDFVILPNEKVLYFRDTSLLNTRDQGLVLTTCGIHLLKDNFAPEEQKFYSWSEIDRIVNCQNEYLFSLVGTTDVIDIPKTYFIKKYQKIENYKQQLASKYVKQVLKTLIDSAPSTLSVDYKKYFCDSLYICHPNDLQLSTDFAEKTIMCKFPKQKQPKEIDEFTKILKQFKIIENEVINKIDNQIKNILKISENYTYVCQQINQNKINQRGHVIPRNKSELKRDGLDFLFYEIVNLFGEAEQERLKEKQKIYRRIIQLQRKKIIDSHLAYIGFQLNEITSTLLNFQNTYLALSQKEYQNDSDVCAMLAMFKFHCEMIFIQQNIRHILAIEIACSNKEKHIQENCLSQQDIVLSELNLLPQLVLGKKVDVLSLWQTISSSTNLPSGIAMIKKIQTI